MLHEQKPSMARPCNGSQRFVRRNYPRVTGLGGVKGQAAIGGQDGYPAPIRRDRHVARHQRLRKWHGFAVQGLNVEAQRLLRFIRHHQEAPPVGEVSGPLILQSGYGQIAWLSKPDRQYTKPRSVLTSQYQGRAGAGRQRHGSAVAQADGAVIVRALQVGDKVPACALPALV